MVERDRQTVGERKEIDPLENVINENVYGFIYKITNMANQKAYVGQHMGIDFGDYWGSGLLLNKAYKKHGKDSFKREVLDYASSKDELNFMECYYIQESNTLTPNGYNIATGGKGGFTGILTEESRKKISNAMKGRQKSEQHKANLSKAKKGIPTHKQTDETRKKISESHLGIEPWNKGKGKPIIQMTMNGDFVQEWGSLTEASKNGFNLSKISECLNGTRKHHKHYLWRISNGQ